mgnify:FL=1|jgi:hypothetical protein
MKSLFRKIRQKLLAENRVGKYLSYALGEIILVVIGILIALQINTWNQQRNQHNTMVQSLQSYMKDLTQDVRLLGVEIKSIEDDLNQQVNFIARLSKPSATIDTLKHILRYEFLPFFSPVHELNRSTIISLLSTGNLDYFEDEISSKILKHNAYQLYFIKGMDLNVSIYLNSQNSREIMQFQAESSLLNGAIIKGPLLEQYWNNKDSKQLLESTLSTISGKILMHRIILGTKKMVLNETEKLLEFLQDYEKSL